MATIGISYNILELHMKNKLHHPGGKLILCVFFIFSKTVHYLKSIDKPIMFDVMIVLHISQRFSISYISAWKLFGVFFYVNLITLEVVINIIASGQTYVTITYVMLPHMTHTGHFSESARMFI